MSLWNGEAEGRGETAKQKNIAIRLIIALNISSAAGHVNPHVNTCHAMIESLLTAAVALIIISIYIESFPTKHKPDVDLFWKYWKIKPKQNETPKIVV